MRVDIYCRDEAQGKHSYLAVPGRLLTQVESRELPGPQAAEKLNAQLGLARSHWKAYLDTYLVDDEQREITKLKPLLADADRVLANLAKVRVVSNFRCAGHEYRTLVSGHAQFGCWNKLMPWDHLAGTLMSQEAGAYAARLDGGPYLPHHVDGGLLVAMDMPSWEELRREVFTF